MRTVQLDRLKNKAGMETMALISMLVLWIIRSFQCAPGGQMILTFTRGRCTTVSGGVVSYTERVASQLGKLRVMQAFTEPRGYPPGILMNWLK